MTISILILKNENIMEKEQSGFFIFFLQKGKKYVERDFWEAHFFPLISDIFLMLKEKKKLGKVTSFHLLYGNLNNLIRTVIHYWTLKAEIT